MKKKKGSESSVHQQIVDYLKIQYPKVIFRTDFASGARMTIGQAVKHKKLQQSRAWPDLSIYHPTAKGSVLFLEIKKDFSEVFTKKGSLVSNEHIREQHEVLENLNNLGYYADWGLGFDNTKKKIDDWMLNK